MKVELVSGERVSIELTAETAIERAFIEALAKRAEKGQNVLVAGGERTLRISADR